MQRSPFTAMSPREQQERWLEFQSIRLPYCRCACEQDNCAGQSPQQSTPSCCETPEKPSCNKESSCEEHTGELTETEKCERVHKEKQRHEVPLPPPECVVKPRHRQYDAVIERMNAACRNAYPYHPTSE